MDFEEKKLIKEIKKLKKVEPSEEWVFSLRGKISKEEKGSFQFLFNPVKNTALALRGVVASFLVLAAAFSYLYYLNNQSPKVYVSQIKSQKADEGQLIASLSKIKGSLDNIKNSLAEIEKNNNPSKVLVTTEVIKGTVNKGKKVIDEIKSKPASKEVYLSLGEINNSLEEIEKTNSEIQKKTVEESLTDLSKRSLSKKDKERLAKAKEYYEKGSITDALILISKIYDKN